MVCVQKSLLEKYVSKSTSQNIIAESCEGKITEDRQRERQKTSFLVEP